MAIRFPKTEIPVLDGFVPGVTSTTSRVVDPALIVEGLAVPVPVGSVGSIWAGVADQDPLVWQEPESY